MSAKAENKTTAARKTASRNSLSRVDETQNFSSVNDITKDFDCLKISILKKASRVSGEFDKVTLGPHAKHENGHVSENETEVESKSNKPSISGTPSSRSKITFSIKKILLENELQRRENVKKVVDQKKKEMEKSQQKIQDELSQLLSQMAIQREKDTAEKIARLEAEEEQLALQLEIDRKNQVQKQRLKESEEISKQILPYRESIFARWKDIVNISKNCRDKNAASRIFTPLTAKLKELSTQMDSLIDKGRTGDLTSADIKMAQIIVQCNDEVVKSFNADIDKINALYDEEIARRELEMRQAELKAQEEALRLQEIQDMQNAAKASQQSVLVEQQEVRHEQQLSNVVIQQTSEVDSGVILQPPQYPSEIGQNLPGTIETRSDNQTEEPSEYPDYESLKIYLDCKELLDKFSLSYQGFVRSDAMKKFKLECQKTITTTINTLTSQRREQLIEKYEKLRLFLAGQGSPNISSNPQAEAYSKNLLAHKIVDQGNTSISKKQDMAFTFAAIAVALWNDYPDFGALLLARFRTISPFLVPIFPVIQKGQSEEEYYKSLGCTYKEDGTPEKPDQFHKRLRGIMYLYAAILVTRQRQCINKPHPHGIGNAWRWLAAALNIEPRCDTADVCSTLIYTLLEVTGNDLWRTYPNQFPKMLCVLNNVYFEKLKGLDPNISTPISRLGDLLTSALEKGCIPPPKGLLPPDFW